MKKETTAQGVLETWLAKTLIPELVPGDMLLLLRAMEEYAEITTTDLRNRLAVAEVDIMELSADVEYLVEHCVKEGGENV